MVTALYRRYRPEAFAELIGQGQVTEPLMQALTADRVNHAYLFSGPRGCGKTTSARILARCLNCHQGPTDTPCGTCPSCVELSRDGGGSLDVVEIDAASHNGVDDARDLRERAVYAPARDRFKIFILDEAHMVTQQGFNALLKIVEEPPEHVKFIFATTEPDKVIGTIRSRTHHYPFRLVPPADLLAYIESVCASEGVSVDEGVLPLVVRAGGGSVRDTLSVLDQLIAGSSDASVSYDRAVGLLGYTHGELLAEVVAAVAGGSGPQSFVALDKVMHTGQDPRRFGEDLLEYVRDLIIVLSAGSEAGALLPGISSPVIDQMRALATTLGPQRLSAMGDVISQALQSMTGATSPRLHLELLMARLLLDGPQESPGASSRASQAPPQAASPSAAPAPSEPKTAESASTGPEVQSSEPAPQPAEPLSFQQLVDFWPAVIEAVAEKKRAVWSALVDTVVLTLVDDVVTIGFPSLQSAEVLKKPQGPGLPVNAELVREAILAVTGHRVRFKVQEIVPEGSNETEPQEEPKPEPRDVTEPASWPTVSPPNAAEPAETEVDAEVPDDTSEPPAVTAAQAKVGEAAIREVLGGELISEHPVSAEDEH
ncbi:MAG: DNA polymerase III subunit gamma and tau [Microbacteriaceae bacterium]|nr:DNA polymerase III subunit gamma and tau [Microbacteriaceae bacterium]